MSDFSAIYEVVADMLPLEGRDYRLNPVRRDGGAVGFEPVAMTKIGKIWLEYLSENLGSELEKRYGRTSRAKKEAQDP